MWPTLRRHDLTLAEPITPGALRLGDVIVFRDPRGDRIIHRIVRSRRSGRFLTCGDATWAADPDPIPGEAVEGRAVCILRGHRTLAIRGGLMGLLAARVRLAATPLRERLMSHLRPRCAALRLDGLWRLAPADRRPRYVRFGTSHRLVAGRWALAEWDSTQRCWRVRSLLRPLVAVERLPAPDESTTRDSTSAACDA
jgi:hypothetical protein